MNLNLSTLRAITTTVLCLVLLIQGINILGYVEANNWLYALISATAIAVIGSYVSQRIADK